MGCRPVEAAYIVQTKTYEKNTYMVKNMHFKFRARVPRRIAKTKSDYFFLLPK